MRYIPIIITLLIALIYVLNKQFPGVIDSNRLDIFYMIAILLSLITGLIRSRIPISILARNILIWIVTALVFVVGYTYRYELNEIKDRIYSELDPATVQSPSPGVAIINIGSSGHFMTNVVVNGTKIRVLIDTGASTVFLTKEDASRIGIDLSSLTYNAMVQTANGNNFAAPIKLDQIQIGSIVIKNVRAMVSREEGGISLLGMSFLSKLSSYSVEKGQLILQQ